MSFLKLMSVTMLMSVMIGGNAVASEKFPKPIVLADNVDDSTYYTKWTAYPLR